MERRLHARADAEALEAPEALGENDLLVKRLQRAVLQRKEELGSGRAVCRRHGINDRDYTWLMKHFTRRKAGQPTISEGKLAELSGKFLGQGHAEA